MIVKFQMQTQTITRDGELRSAKKNAAGWYPAIPVFVFDETSRNGYPYDADYMFRAHTQPNKYFFEACRDGVAHGEYGHPDFSHCINADQLMMRMAHVDKTRMSHIMSNISIIPTESKRGGVVLLDIKPHGPHGPHLEKELIDPTLNATFSVRTILDQSPENRIYHRNPNNPKRVDNVIAYDSVGLNGFSAASKRGQRVDNFTMEGYRTKSFEGIDIDVDMHMVNMDLITEVITTENITANILLDGLRANMVQVKTCSRFIGTIDSDDRSIHTRAGRASLVHELLGRK